MDIVSQIMLGIGLGCIGTVVGVILYFGRPLSKDEEEAKADEENA